jgi:RNA polymerase sigma factor (sigma-70 family)
MAGGFNELLEHLHRTGGGLTDGQLLGRFLSTRDEDAFAALVRRHGPMVFGVCRRVLGDFQEAEDAFQATFLILARKASSVVNRESLGGWLHQVASRAALRARAGSTRRRARERPMQDVPHPEVAPAEPQDWRPLLDRELGRLPEKYRAAIVLCDLEGRTRREAARLLNLPEGTLSSRLAAGRRLLAKRLARSGLAVSGGLLAAALARPSGCPAGAQVPSALVRSTAKAAALVAAGQVAAVTPAAFVLVQGVIRAMFLNKVGRVVGAVLLVAALGAVGLAYQAGGKSGTVQAAPPDKAPSELEALRKENELLKLNLQVVLEKVRAQEAELRALRAGSAPGAPGAPGPLGPGRPGATPRPEEGRPGTGSPDLPPRTGPAGGSPVPGEDSFLRPLGSPPPVDRGTPASDPVREAEAALKRLREASDTEGQRQAVEAMQRALDKLKHRRTDLPPVREKMP